MNKNTNNEIITSLIKKGKCGELELKKLMNIIDSSVDKLGKYINNIILSLYLIRKNKLYLFDKCEAFKQFVIKNNYSDKLNIVYRTIKGRMYLLEYAEKNLVPINEAIEMSQYKLEMMSARDVKGGKLIKEYSLIPCKELRKKLLYKRDKIIGRFLAPKKESFDQRLKTSMKSMMFEVPWDREKDFEAGIVHLCAKCDVRIP